MATGSDLIEAARCYRDVPFLHGGRGPCGVDCVGLILAAVRAVGLPALEPPGYPRSPDPEALRRELLARCAMVDSRAPAAGDICLFTFHAQALHLGLATGEATLLHAWERAGRVVEHAFDGFWQARWVGAYRWEGLAVG